MNPRCVSVSEWAFAKIEQSQWVNKTQRITPHIVIKRTIPTPKPNRILDRPPPSVGIIIPRPEPYQPGVPVVQPPSKPERLEPRIAVAQHIAPLVVVDALRDLAGGAVDYKAHRSQLVADDAVGCATLDHVIRHIGLARVDEARYHIALPIQFRRRLQLVLVEEALGECAVDLFADAPV